MGAHGITFAGAVFGESETSAHWNIRRIYRTSLPKQSLVSSIRNEFLEATFIIGSILIADD